MKINSNKKWRDEQKQNRTWEYSKDRRAFKKSDMEKPETT
jgi:hypothetical protein